MPSPDPSLISRAQEGIAAADKKKQVASMVFDETMELYNTYKELHIQALAAAAAEATSSNFNKATHVYSKNLEEAQDAVEFALEKEEQAAIEAVAAAATFSALVGNKKELSWEEAAAEGARAAAKFKEELFGVAPTKTQTASSMDTAKGEVTVAPNSKRKAAMVSPDDSESAGEGAQRSAKCSRNISNNKNEKTAACNNTANRFQGQQLAKEACITSMPARSLSYARLALRKTILETPNIIVNADKSKFLCRTLKRRSCVVCQKYFSGLGKPTHLECILCGAAICCEEDDSANNGAYAITSCLNEHLNIQNPRLRCIGLPRTAEIGNFCHSTAEKAAANKAPALASNNPQRQQSMEKSVVTRRPRRSAFKFAERVEQIREFKRQHGHADISTTKSGNAWHDLGMWLSHERCLHKKGRLQTEKSVALRTLGCLGFRRRHTKFQDRVEQLKAFKNLRGHAHVTTEKGSPSRALGIWLAHQRSYFKKGKLRRERLEILRGLNCPGFETIDGSGAAHPPSRHSPKFLGRVKEVKAFKKLHGHANITKAQDSPYFPLGQWLSNQRLHFREGRLNKERLKILRGLGCPGFVAIDDNFPVEQSSPRKPAPRESAIDYV